MLFLVTMETFWLWSVDTQEQFRPSHILGDLLLNYRYILNLIFPVHRFFWNVTQNYLSKISQFVDFVLKHILNI